MSWGRILFNVAKVLIPTISLSVLLVIGAAWAVAQFIPGMGFGRALVFLWASSMIILLGMGSQKKYR